MQNVVKNCELISALADGQLAGEEFARAVEWVGSDEAAQQAWHTYHVVGDVLRGGEAMADRHDAAFMQRLRLSLKQEAPWSSAAITTDSIAINPTPVVNKSINQLNNTSANESRFRWKLLAGFASLAAVSVIGWQASQGGNAPDGAPQLAQAPIQAQQPEPAHPSVAAGVEDDAPRMIRDPRLDLLLAAHRQLGGTSALQMPAGFLRNATFEGAAR